MRSISCALVAFALAMAVAVPALGRNEEENWDRCLQPDKVGPLEPDDVIEACRFVLRMDFIRPNVRNDAFNNIGVAEMRLHKTDEAIHAFDEALRKIKELPDVREVRQLGNYTRRNRAIAYVATKQYDKALDDVDKMAATEAIPEYLALRCLYHSLYDDNFASALPDCQKAVDQDPKKAGDAYAAFLIVEYRQGKYEDVKNDCKLVREKAELSPDAMYVCGLAERRLGNADLARAMLPLADAMDNRVAERFKELGIE
ncbi:MAG: hypothetical protein WCA81_15605 [Rhizomicrobium sp.]